MLRIEAVFMPMNGFESVKEVFPSIDPEAEPDWPAVVDPDGSMRTPSGVLISFGQGEFPLAVRFNRPSRRAAGELICRLLERKITFETRGTAMGIGNPNSSQLGAATQFWGLSLHPELGRCAWDSRFRESHPELSWAFPNPPKDRRISFEKEEFFEEEEFEIEDIYDYEEKMS